jgi:hypothetical protein
MPPGSRIGSIETDTGTCVPDTCTTASRSETLWPRSVHCRFVPGELSVCAAVPGDFTASPPSTAKGTIHIDHREPLHRQRAVGIESPRNRIPVGLRPSQ